MLTRREFLSLSGIALGGLCMMDAESGPGSAVQAADRIGRTPPIFSHYSQLLETLKERGHEWQVLGYAPDRSPLVAVKAGGDKLPAIFVSAGAHSTEHAGVVASLELLDHLQTDHQVYVVPTRDPIGLNGFRYALSLSLGEEPPLTSVDEAETLMRQEGDVLYDEDGTLLVVIGEHGYANRSLYRHVEKGAPFLEALRGRRLWWPSDYRDVDGSGPLERAYTQVVTPDAEVLHLNRLHDTPWAPAEIRATRRFIHEIRPGLTFDLHEYAGTAYWMSARHQQRPENERLEKQMAQACVRAVADAGAELAAENYSPGSFFKTLARGAYWLEAKQRGEGLNLIDFAARRFGPAFTIETGMRNPFAKRVELQRLVVQTAVRLFEQHHAG